MLVNKGCVDVDQEATTGTSGLFVPCVIAVHKHLYVHWFAQGHWGIGVLGKIGSLTLPLFPIHYWEMVIVNVWIGLIHAYT